MGRLFSNRRYNQELSRDEQELSPQKDIRSVVTATQPFERYGERTIEGEAAMPGRVQQTLPSRNTQPNSAIAPKWSAFHQDVSADSTVYPFVVSWQPKYWFFVARLTAGYIRCHPGGTRAGYHLRINSGTVRLLAGNDTFSIETVGATGWFSVYPVSDLNAFNITA